MKSLRAFFDRYWLAVAFYVACPIVISFPLGLFHAGLGRYMTTPAACLLWAASWLTTWLLSELLFRIARVLLRPWQPRLLPLLLIASAAQILLSPFYMGMISRICFAIGGIDVPLWVTRRQINLFDPSYLSSLIVSGSYGMFAWCSLRWVYEHYRLSKSKSVYSAMAATRSVDAVLQPEVSPTPQPSERLLSQLRKNGIGELASIEVIEAEDHYVRLHLAQGSRLVFYRFADILSEVRGSDGFQVHRSFWVRRACIADVQQDASGLRLQMRNGLTIPVSHKYRALLGYLLENRDPARN